MKPIQKKQRIPLEWRGGVAPNEIGRCLGRGELLLRARTGDDGQTLIEHLTRVAGWQLVTEGNALSIALQGGMLTRVFINKHSNYLEAK